MSKIENYVTEIAEANKVQQDLTPAEHGCDALYEHPGVFIHVSGCELERTNSAMLLLILHEAIGYRRRPGTRERMPLESFWSVLPLPRKKQIVNS